MTTIPAPDPEVAGHARRLAAASLDALAYIALVVASSMAGCSAGLAITGGPLANDELIAEGPGRGLVVGGLLGFAGWIVMTVWLVRRPGACNGQTLGKEAVGIRVVRADHKPVGVGTALLREVLTKWMLILIAASLISWVLGFFDAGTIGLLVAVAVWYGTAFADDQCRALHDRMCSTRVVAA